MDFIVRPGPRLLPMGWFPRMSAVPRDHRHRPVIATRGLPLSGAQDRRLARASTAVTESPIRND